MPIKTQFTKITCLNIVPQIGILLMYCHEFDMMVATEYPLFPYYDYALGAGTPKAVSILRIAGLSSVCNAP